MLLGDIGSGKIFTRGTWFSSYSSQCGSSSTIYLAETAMCKKKLQTLYAKWNSGVLNNKSKIDTWLLYIADVRFIKNLHL